MEKRSCICYYFTWNVPSPRHADICSSHSLTSFRFFLRYCLPEEVSYLK